MPGMAVLLSQAINRDAIPPYLTKLLGKASKVEQRISLSRSLFNHFSDKPVTSSDLPLCDLNASGQMIIQADPCYLHADRDRLLLFAKGLTLTEQESEELIGEIQPLLSDFGALNAVSPTDWQLSLKQRPEIEFSALDEVEGKSVDAFLPTGTARREWVGLWNEIQMQLYNADLNQHRIASGQLPVNSVWFWGMGAFEATQTQWQSVSGKSALLKQLAATNQLSVQQGDMPLSWPKGKHLYLLDEIDTESDWQGKLLELDNTVFAALWQQLSKASINTLTLQVPKFADYRITPLRRWQFWK